MVEEQLHPLARFALPGKRPPRMWAEGLWKVYLDSCEAIENAIHYVEPNPEREERPAQRWSCVTPFAGLTSGLTTYH